MKKNLTKLCVLALAAIMTLSLFACQDTGSGNVTTSGADNVTTETTTTDVETTLTTESQVTTEGTTEATTSVTTEATTEETTEVTTVDDPYADVYEDGEEITGAGIEWDSDAFASVDHEIIEAGAEKIDAEELMSLLAGGQIEPGAVYNVTGELVISVTGEFDAKGAALILDDGMTVNAAEGLTISNMLIKGDVTVKDSSKVTLKNVEIEGGSTALTVSGKCSELLFEACRITATDVAVKIDADGAAIYKSYLAADKGVVIDADYAMVQNSHIVALSSGVSGKGYGAVVRENLIETPADTVAVSFDGASNLLVALNVIKGSQKSIEVVNGFNCVVVLNNATRIIAKNNSNVFVISNAVSGRMILETNDRIICDANKSPEDGKVHNTVDVDNLRKNGDDITDVNARLDVGANEEILPQTDKDLFVGMRRETTIRDLDSNSNLNLIKYIENHAKDGVVIVPPAAYLCSGGMTFSERCAGATIYAYGAMREMQNYGQSLSYSSTTDIDLYGLTFGYVPQSAGQIHIIDKLGFNQLLVVAAAGYENLHLTKNGGFYDWFTKEKDGSTALYPVANLSFDIADNGDGTATLTLKGDDVKEYFNIKVGDIITCRTPGANTNTIGITNSHNLIFKDVVIYGYANALAYVITSGSSNISLDRVHNTARSGMIISEDMYNQYVAWEEEYDVDLEVYIDDNGNYRGSLPRIGSVDATHLSNAGTGLNVVNTTFEQMTDDGSNHHGMSSRLHNVVDNEDGTTFIYYKANASEYYYKNGTLVNCENFEEGDKIFIYSPKTGAVLCDTVALSDAKKGSQIKFTIEDKNFSTYVYRVKVPTEDVNFDVLEGFDLSDNHYSVDNKFLVDNMSNNSAGLFFDNVLIQNHRSRGILVKTRDAEIRNCTFRNLGHNAILLDIEVIWGESSVAQNVVIADCLIDHVGHTDRLYTYNPITPIYIGSAGTDIANVDLACRNVTVTGCKFINNEHATAIFIKSAQDITITNNDFGLRNYNGAQVLSTAVAFYNAKNVHIDGNTSPTGTLGLRGDNYMNITGSNTVDENGETKFPDKIN